MSRMLLGKVALVFMLIFPNLRALCAFFALPERIRFWARFARKMRPQNFLLHACSLLASYSASHFANNTSFRFPCGFVSLNMRCGSLHMMDAWPTMSGGHGMFRCGALGRHFTAACSYDRIEQYKIGHIYGPSIRGNVVHCTGTADETKMHIPRCPEEMSRDLTHFRFGRGVGGIPSDEGAFRKALNNLNQEFLTLALKR